jgi:predicted nucleotidyltransferase component of viral defense system
MKEEVLQHFDLVGGTALALRFGHRLSVDIDLFTEEEFDSVAIARVLQSNLNLTESQSSTNTIRGVIDGIKVDLIRHHYPKLAPTECVKGVRLASLKDLAAMKLNAISNRGSKKDFWDLHRLLQERPLDHWIDCATSKYPSDSEWNIRRSLCYFDDAENDPPPRDLRGMEWERIKDDIRKAVPL